MIGSDDIMTAIKADLLEDKENIVGNSVMDQFNINKYHPFDKGLIIDIKEYNNTYYIIVFSAWSYQGNPDNSTAFLLEPKTQIRKKLKEYKSFLGKNKNDRIWFNSITGRMYLPIEIEKYINQAIDVKTLKTLMI